MVRATDRFLTEIRGSHHAESYIDAVGPTGETRRLTVVDGSVSVDRTAQFRRTLSCTCVDPEGVLVPTGSSGILLPVGTELRPYRGVIYHNADGSTESEFLPLGVFRLSKTDITEGATSSVGVTFKLETFDRSRKVARDKFSNIYVIPVGTNIVDAIKLILARSYTDLSYDAITTPRVTAAPMVFDSSNDPWEACYNLAVSVGCELYFDADGSVVIAPPIDIDALPAPDFTYIEDQHNTMTNLGMVFSDEPGFNGVIVVGASLGNDLPPVRAESWDTDPSSPTYYLGPYGKVPEFITDQNVTTAADAQVVADTQLKGRLGVPSQLAVTAWTNPALEAGNVVEVRRAKMNVAGLYVVDSFTVPLKGSSPQTINVRQNRTGA